MVVVNNSLVTTQKVIHLMTDDMVMRMIEPIYNNDEGAMMRTMMIEPALMIMAVTDENMVMRMIEPIHTHNDERAMMRMIEPALMAVEIVAVTDDEKVVMRMIESIHNDEGVMMRMMLMIEPALMAVEIVAVTDERTEMVIEKTEQKIIEKILKAIGRAEVHYIS